MNTRRLIKFIGFNILWLLTAKFALSSYLNILTVIIVGLYILELRKLDWKNRFLTWFVFVIGVGFDGFAQYLNWVQLSGPIFFVLPQWLISLWILFIWVLPDLIYQFIGRRWLFVAISSVAGPLSYYAGENFDVVKFFGITSWAAYAVFWGGLMYASHVWIVGGNYGIKK